jgi:hypothetical protein
MPQPAIRTNLDEPLDIPLNLTAQITLNHVIPIHDITNRSDLCLRQLRVTLIGADASLFQNVVAGLTTDPVNVGQANLNALIPWQVNACNTYHILPPLTQIAKDERLALPGLSPGVAYA